MWEPLQRRCLVGVARVARCRGSPLKRLPQGLLHWEHNPQGWSRRGWFSQGKKRPSSEGLFFPEIPSCPPGSLFPRAFLRSSVDGVERVVADLANDAAGGPARCDGDSGEMIGLRHVYEAFALGQAPVVHGVAGDLPCLGPRHEIGDLEILRRGGDRELARGLHDFADIVATHAAIAATEGDFRHGVLADGGFAACFEVNRRRQARLVGEVAWKDGRHPEQSGKFHVYLPPTSFSVTCGLEEPWGTYER